MHYKRMNIFKEMFAGFHILSFNTRTKNYFLTHRDNDGYLNNEETWKEQIVSNDFHEHYPIVKFENVPTKGFKLYEVDEFKVNLKKDVPCIIQDPRGFNFIITMNNLLYIIKHVPFINNEFQGELIYIHYKDNQYFLTPTNSELYNNLIKYKELEKNDFYIREADLVIGHTYILDDLTENVYLGKHSVYENNNYFKEDEHVKNKVTIYSEYKGKQLFFYNEKTEEISTYTLKSIKGISKNEINTNTNIYLSKLFELKYLYPLVEKEKFYINEMQQLKALLCYHIKIVNNSDDLKDTSSFLLFNEDNTVAFEVVIDKFIERDLNTVELEKIEMRTDKELTDEFLYNKSIVMFNIFFNKLEFIGKGLKRTIKRNIYKRYELKYDEMEHNKSDNNEEDELFNEIFLSATKFIKVEEHNLDSLLRKNWSELKEDLKGSHHFKYGYKHHDNDDKYSYRESFIQVNYKI